MGWTMGTRKCSVGRLLTLFTTLIFISEAAFRQPASNVCPRRSSSAAIKFIRRNHATRTHTFQKSLAPVLAFLASSHTTSSITDSKTRRVIHSLHSWSNNNLEQQKTQETWTGGDKATNCYTDDEYYNDIYFCKVDQNNQEDPFEKCWAATSSSVNPRGDPDIDEILQGLNSPAPQSFFVIERALCMAQTETEQQRAFETCHYLLKANHCFSYRTQQRQQQLPNDVNIRMYHRPGIDWSVISQQKEQEQLQQHGSSSESWQVVYPPDGDDDDHDSRTVSATSSAIQQANAILNLVVEASNAQDPVDETLIGKLVENLERHLYITLGTDIRARKSADAAFSLALAGVVATTTTTSSQNDIYNVLVRIAQLEMQRLSGRSSPRRVKDILHIVEKMAAAGCTGLPVQKLYRLAAESDILQADGNVLVDNYDVAKILRASSSSSSTTSSSTTSSSLESFNLLSERPMIWLWRFAARQTKAREKTIISDVARKPITPTHNNATTNNKSFNATTVNVNSSKLLYSTQSMTKFANPSKPLVLDIGCGLGTSLLGLASLDSGKIFSDALSVHSVDVNWNECNYLGGDLSQLGTRFGNEIAMRWNLTHRLQFTYSSASHLLETVEASTLTYPELTVAGILINFPSPYRLISKENSTTGNSQLPSSPDDSFVVSRSVMERVAALLKSSSLSSASSDSATKGGCFLLLQSNCEDVAIELRDLAISCGLECVPAKHPVRPTDSASSAPILRLTNRAVEWRERGGEPAVGPEWSAVPLLPKGCATETEVSCMFHSTPVHRCLLQWSKKV